MTYVRGSRYGRSEIADILRGLLDDFVLALESKIGLSTVIRELQRIGEVNRRPAFLPHKPDIRVEIRQQISGRAVRMTNEPWVGDDLSLDAGWLTAVFRLAGAATRGRGGLDALALDGLQDLVVVVAVVVGVDGVA